MQIKLHVLLVPLFFQIVQHALVNKLALPVPMDFMFPVITVFHATTPFLDVKAAQIQQLAYLAYKHTIYRTILNVFCVLVPLMDAKSVWMPAIVSFANLDSIT
jgi:hypothetical protein